MAVFSKESLETLREKIDLKEVLNPYLNLKKAGSAYKALCPFHNEKTPSFVVQSGDSHYHCFGCGAHGDAIAFLMHQLKLTFTEAIEMLAEKFSVPLEYKDQKGEKGPDLHPLRAALNVASEFFHFHLLHSDEGHLALHYLYQRGIDLEFIRLFKVGFAPKNEMLQIAFYKEKRLKEEALIESGLVKRNTHGRLWSFFSNRITFPVFDISNNVIGFSARKIHEETFGGKYINTSETPLFKKSKILFGLNHSRRRIAKERKVIVVEGQIDALRLIQEGINFTVAGQGTAFGQAHVEQLSRLGINCAYLAFDGDLAGREAAQKVGQLFQKEGIEVLHVILPEDSDPDLILQKEGPEGFLSYLDKAKDHIAFLVSHYSLQMNIKTPAGKNQLARKIVSEIQEWKHPLMIHEGLKRLADLLQVPEAMIEIDQKAFLLETPSKTFKINPDQIIETDLLRWVIIGSQNQLDVIEIAKKNLTIEDFKDSACKKIYKNALSALEKNISFDLLILAQDLNEEEQELLNQMLEKKVNVEKAEEGIIQAVEKILERNWMVKREQIKMQIQNGKHSEEKILEFAKAFDEIKKNQPKVIK